MKKTTKTSSKKKSKNTKNTKKLKKCKCGSIEFIVEERQSWLGEILPTGELWLSNCEPEGFENIECIKCNKKYTTDNFKKLQW